MNKPVLLIATAGITVALSLPHCSRAQNTGIGTLSPGTTLDVAGAITARESTGAVLANTIEVPVNTSQFQITGAATATIAITAPAAPNAGQMLTIFNNSTGGFGATLNGVTVANGQSLSFIYTNGAWRATDNGATANPPATLYTADGTLTGARTVTTGANKLSFANGTKSITLDLATSNDALLQLKSNTSSNWTRIGTTGQPLAIITGGTQATDATTTNIALFINQAGKVGINSVTAPGTQLDVNGGLTLRETNGAVTANAVTVPGNTSQFQITGTATATVTITAPNAPSAGQRLLIYNNTTGGFGATLAGVTVANGQLQEFTYSNGAWRPVDNGMTANGNAADWHMAGNGGTNAATQFIGTTDAQPLALRVNNAEVMRISRTATDPLLQFRPGSSANWSRIGTRGGPLAMITQGNDSTSTHPSLYIGGDGNVVLGDISSATSHFTVVSNTNGSTTADDMDIQSYNPSPDINLNFVSAQGTQNAPANLATATSLGALNAYGRVNGANTLLNKIANNYSGDGTTTLSNMAFSTSGSERLRINENGNIGIGSTAPTEKLSVGAASTSGPLSISVQNSNGQGRIGMASAPGEYSAPQAGDLMINETTAGKGIGFSINATPAVPVYISSTGKVGINQTSPSASLDIVGTMQLVDGTQGANKVLTSDANGNASWAAPSAASHLRSIVIGTKDFQKLSSGVTLAEVGGWGMNAVEIPDGGNFSYAQLTVVMPADWNGTAISSCKLLYSSPSTAGNFVVLASHKSLSAGSSVNQGTTGTDVTLSPSSSSNAVVEASIPVSIPAGTKLVNFLIVRRGLDNADTNTGVLDIYGVRIEYND